MENFSSEISENILDYILGGDSCFCVKQSDETGTKECWYSVRQNQNSPRMYFVSLVERNRNKYLGYFYSNDIGQLRNLTVKTKQPEAGAEYALPLIRVLNRLKTHEGRLWGGVSIVSDGRCSKCGRRITDPESIRYGLGPKCRERLGLK